MGSLVDSQNMVQLSISGGQNYRRRPRKSKFPHRAPFNCILDLHRLSSNDNGNRANHLLDYLHQNPGPKKTVFPKTLSRKRRKRSSPANNSETVPHNGNRNSKRAKLVSIERPPAQNVLSSDNKLDGIERIPQLKFKFRLPVRNKKTNLSGVLDKQSPQTNVLQYPPLPEKFMTKIRQLGYSEDPVLVIQKELFTTDIKEGNQRLSIPVNQVISKGFLTDKEKDMLGDRNLNGSIKSILIDDHLTEWEIPLKRWAMSKSGQYVLIAPWNKVVKENGLRVGVRIQVWSFRMNGQMYFVLVKL
ncbi:OLC1v1022696C1 [Oldenlandia corymbosa var. corymbosa]|uniref:OLC1v1022696C1 n=1 Tax=Oldenlandia corymbosa var. corymbosa TaxID=529605 RepID=A0AAV1BZ29_OLDCO|nr:OLC1v1022696C1 [Oldenlandia corymbosa var. corymbosa]